MLKDVGISKEFFDYEFDRIRRIGVADCDKQNILVHFRFHQFPSKLYHARKKLKKKIWFKTLFEKKEQYFYIISQKKLTRIIVIPSNFVVLT